jgi:hypothetical protein
MDAIDVTAGRECLLRVKHVARVNYDLWPGDDLRDSPYAPGHTLRVRQCADSEMFEMMRENRIQVQASNRVWPNIRFFDDFLTRKLNFPG